jgi:hypothetical protein
MLDLDGGGVLLEDPGVEGLRLVTQHEVVTKAIASNQTDLGYLM